MLDNKTSSDSKGRFASEQAIRESLSFAEEDLKFVREELDAANKKIVELEAENAELTNRLKGK